MEFDTSRAGNFEPLRFLPKGHKQVVLGIVSTKIAELEDKQAMVARIREAAQYAPLEQLAVSPQCGFSSTHHGNNVSFFSFFLGCCDIFRWYAFRSCVGLAVYFFSQITTEDQWAKLRLVNEIAEEVGRFDSFVLSDTSLPSL